LGALPRSLYGVGEQMTPRFAAALTFAERLHRAQTRKGNDIPYIAHLMAVCATALEWGADEDTAIALLHDAVEDQGGVETLKAIEARFGGEVARIVAACTDSITADPAQKAPWLDRKQAHIGKLAGADKAVALVTAADKLHNLTAMIRDVRQYGPGTLARFNTSPDRLLWYFTSIAKALRHHRDVVPVGDIERGVATLRDLLGIVAPVDAVNG
jgi:(p)ppGpp synthase/HD superfamily hydrolase